MNVVMLGHSNAGKTTYMASMYRDLATQGLQGFWVRAQQEGDHRRLLSMANRVASGKYPRPSDRRHEYALTLRHQGSPVIDFHWKDHRGGALRERSTSGQTRELLDDLHTADAILLFLDAPQLARGGRVGAAPVRDLTTRVAGALDRRTDPTPVVVLLTKADLIDEEEFDACMRALDAFINAIRGKQLAFGTVIDVACGPQPRNVPVPVLFSLYFGLRLQAEAAHGRTTQAALVAQQRLAADTRVRRILGRFGGRRYDLEAQLATAGFVSEWQALDSLVSPTQALETMLGDVPVF